MSDLYRQLPAVDAVLDDPRLAGLPREVVVWSAREVLASIRARIRDGSLTTLPDVAQQILRQAQLVTQGRLVPVINATGVVVHTNLGRSVWCAEAVAAAGVAANYCNLEMDLATGKRGGRLDAIAAQLSYLTGAESALVVNNCAAAVLLALTALAKGKGVVVSRGELVEIGGSFRVPDVIASGGATLVEVGTTNRTRVADFENAIDADTAVLLRIHPSNFRVVGFTEQPVRSELARVAHAHGLPLLEDLGSGSLTGEYGETAVREALDDGADLVMFSGDKLLGGPQAGVIAGKASWVRALRTHPLYRALRIDKTLLAALEATLAVHARGESPPTPCAIGQELSALAEKAQRLSAKLSAHQVPHAVLEDQGFVGGGALPGQGLPTRVIALSGDVGRWSAALRLGSPAVVARITEGTLRFDVRTVREEQLDSLADQIALVCRVDAGDRRDKSTG